MCKLMCKFTHVKKFKMVNLSCNMCILYYIVDKFLINNWCISCSNKNLSLTLLHVIYTINGLIIRIKADSLALVCFASRKLSGAKMRSRAV